MPEQTADPWREILREAMSAHTSWPLPGSKFLVTVNSAAYKRDQRFPPPNEPQLRFSQLLGRYPDIVSILRRPGQDILVAPTDKSDLLTKGIRAEPYAIRRDFFDAFTTVSHNHRYYNKEADRIEWRKPGEDRALGDALLPIDPPTTATEVQLRRDFAESPENSACRATLLKALEGASPFSTFSQAVREAGVQRGWHTFRMKRLQERIQSWASDKKLAWKDAWLAARPTAYKATDHAARSLLPPDARFKREDGDPVQLLFSGLDAVDMQRISIPLDLVLKAISSKR